MTAPEIVTMATSFVSTIVVVVGVSARLSRYMQQTVDSIDKLTEQVQRTNGTVSEIQSGGCLFRREHIRHEEIIAGAVANEAQTAAVAAKAVADAAKAAAEAAQAARDAAAALVAAKPKVESEC